MLGPVTLTVAASTQSLPVSVDALKTGAVSVQTVATTSGAGGLVYNIQYSVMTPPQPRLGGSVVIQVRSPRTASSPSPSRLEPYEFKSRPAPRI
jgi:hypothetical protein